MPEEPSELRALIQRSQVGDREALADLVRRYRQPVFNLALLFLRSRSEAEDVAQDAFVRVFRSLDRFRFECSFETWLFRIVRNLCIDLSRSARRAARTTDRLESLAAPADSSNDPERRLLQEERSHRVRVALGQLKPEYREVLLLRYVAELPYQGIGDVLGWSLGTVCSRLSRALKRLGALLQESTEDL